MQAKGRQRNLKIKIMMWLGAQKLLTMLISKTRHWQCQKTKLNSSSTEAICANYIFYICVAPKLLPFLSVNLPLAPPTIPSTSSFGDFTGHFPEDKDKEAKPTHVISPDMLNNSLHYPVLRIETTVPAAKHTTDDPQFGDAWLLFSSLPDSHICSYLLGTTVSGGTGVTVVMVCQCRHPTKLWGAGAHRRSQRGGVSSACRIPEAIWLALPAIRLEPGQWSYYSAMLPLALRWCSASSFVCLSLPHTLSRTLAR